MPRIAVAVIALIAVFVGVMYLRFSGDTRDTHTLTPPVGVGALGTGSPVFVVATRHIPKGTRIEADMVEIGMVPPAEMSPYAYSDIERVVGMHALCDIGAGEPVGAPKIDNAWRLNDGSLPDASVIGWPNCADK